MAWKASSLRRVSRSRELGLAIGAATVASLVFGFWPASAADPDGWHIIGAPTEPAFIEGAVNVNSFSGIPYYDTAFRNAGGDLIEFRGVVGPDIAEGGMDVISMTGVLMGDPGASIYSPGGYGSLLFTLPCGYRPANIVALPGVASDTFGKAVHPGGVIVMPSGEVYVTTYAAPQINGAGVTMQMTFPLDGMSFHADKEEVCEGPTTTDAPTTTAEVTTTTAEETTTTSEPDPGP